MISLSSLPMTIHRHHYRYKRPRRRHLPMKIIFLVYIFFFELS